eukprot:8566446-Pyramimonas_sp.AAC.1
MQDSDWNHLKHNGTTTSLKDYRKAATCSSDIATTSRSIDFRITLQQSFRQTRLKDVQSLSKAKNAIRAA